MTPEEAQLINGLHDRLEQMVSQPRDHEAERLIQSRVAANPLAPYLLTQSTLVLQQAVTGAQTRIADLEKQLAEAKAQQGAQTGSFLSGVANLFGAPQPPAAPSARQTAPPPIPQQPVQTASTPSQGGSFLQTALGTAAGVAGGALLFQGIENLMGHNAGAFGGMGTSTGGLLGQNQPTEIINNYYESPTDTTQDDSGFDDQAGMQVADNDDPCDAVTGDDFGQDMDLSGGDDV